MLQTSSGSERKELGEGVQIAVGTIDPVRKRKRVETLRPQPVEAAFSVRLRFEAAGRVKQSAVAIQPDARILGKRGPLAFLCGQGGGD